MPDQNDGKRPGSPGRAVMIWSLVCGGFLFVFCLLAVAKNGWDNDLPTLLSALPLLTALGVGVGWLMRRVETMPEKRRSGSRSNDPATYHVSNFVNGNLFKCAKCGKEELWPKETGPTHCSGCGRIFTGFS